jgi:hypothetical protein
MAKGDIRVAPFCNTRGNWIWQQPPQWLSWDKEGTPFWWFIQAVNIGRGSHCLDKRDKIYSVLGIASRHFSNGSLADFLTPDYNIPAEELFSQITVNLLKHSKSLDVLSFVCGHSKTLNLPTWVTDWSVGSKTIPLTHLRVRFNAGLCGLSNSPRFTATAKTMTCFGARFDIIEEVQEYRHSDLKGNNIVSFGLKHFYSLLQFCLTLPENINGKCRMEVFWRTLIANNSMALIGGNSMEEGQPAAPIMETALVAYVKSSLAELIRISIHDGGMNERQAWEHCSILAQLDFKWAGIEEPLCVQDVKHIYGLLQAEMNAPRYLQKSVAEALSPERATVFIYDKLTRLARAGRRLFRTEQGFLGLGPEEARKGDQIWLICDAFVPFVLRPTSTQNTFTLVGETYVHDFMNGEMLNDSYILKDRIGPVYLV